MRRRLGLMALGFCCALPSGPAAAEEAAPMPAASTQCPICRHANNPAAPYTESAAGSLARGAANTLFGWTEMLTRPTAEVERSGNLLAGVGYGVTHAARRTVAGVGELLTFWMPKSPESAPPLVTDCPICMAVPRPPAASSPPAAAAPVR